VSRRFTGYFVPAKPAKFLINERKQFISGFPVTTFDGLKDSSDVTHVKWAGLGVGYALRLENPRTKFAAISLYLCK
jgi:hypothetical protein